MAVAQDAESINTKAKEYIRSGDMVKAVTQLNQAAALGHPEAQYNLGYCYQMGSGVEKDMNIAVEWYTKSAQQGFNDASFQLMMIYGNGNGVEKDMNKAFAYALECANNNDPTCMFNLVNCYKMGAGTAPNRDKVVEWALRLGKLPDPTKNINQLGYITSARLNLARMYRDGDDVEKDPYSSYLWFMIYNESKGAFSTKDQQQIIGEIKRVEAMLTPAQLASAKVDAEKLLGRPLKKSEKLYKTGM
jgi:TPR repeat protein